MEQTINPICRSLVLFRCSDLQLKHRRLDRCWLDQTHAEDANGILSRRRQGELRCQRCRRDPAEDIAEARRELWGNWGEGDF